MRALALLAGALALAGCNCQPVGDFERCLAEERERCIDHYPKCTGAAQEPLPVLPGPRRQEDRADDRHR